MIRKLAPGEFDRVYEIMAASFPADEHRPYGEQKTLLAREEYEVYLWTGEDGGIRAFAAVWEFGSFAFVEHLAVDPLWRNHGVGGEFLQALLAALGKLVCLEVEPPESEITARRIGFYQRHNFFLNPYPYTQPPISAGRRPVPLQLMTYGRSISAEEFAEMKRTLFTWVYQQSETLVE